MKDAAIGFLQRACVIAVLAVLCPTAVVLAQTPVDAGYRDFSFGTTTTSTPTGDKPESKLWWNDGIWWGSMFDTVSQTFHIFRFDPAAQSWSDTGTRLDDRRPSKADALWEAATGKLYIASHRWTTVNGLPTGTFTTDVTQWARLYRYSYDPSTKTYTLDTGFPVTNGFAPGTQETLTLAKDSVGRLWVTYVQDTKVMVNNTLGDDTAWGTATQIPTIDPNAPIVTTDDIADVIAFGGNKIGVMWSNQNPLKMYFAVHDDSDWAGFWQPEEVAYELSADDHINLKTDSTGRVFAAVKTSNTSLSSPLVALLERSAAGAWSSYTYGIVSENHTRPIVLLNEVAGQLYMFATDPEAGGAIYYKSTSINAPAFATGIGNAFIKSSSDITINNASSTKQNVTPASGLLVIASDQNTKFYLHNLLPMPGAGGLTIGETVDSATLAQAASWNISKTATPLTFTGSVGKKAKFNYTVTVTNTSITFNSAAVTGSVTVTNPNGADFSGTTVSVAVNNGGNCVVTNGANVTIPANSSQTLSYSCTYASQPTSSSGTATATVTWDPTIAGTTDSSASSNANFAFATTTTNGTVTVTDTFQETTNTLGTASTSTSPKTFQYSRTVKIGTSCQTYTNTAQIVETGQTTSASVQACKR
jgi:hypothetical protein